MCLEAYCEQAERPNLWDFIYTFNESSQTQSLAKQLRSRPRFDAHKVNEKKKAVLGT